MDDSLALSLSTLQSLSVRPPPNPVDYSRSCSRGVPVPLSRAQAYALDQLSEEDDDLQRVIVEKNMHTFGRIVVGIVAALKALSWQGLLATCPQVLGVLSDNRTSPEMSI